MPTPVETEESELTICDRCRTVPVPYLTLDLSMPLGGWGAMLEVRGVEVVIDDLGRPAVARERLGELIAERDAADARMAEDAQRRSELIAERDATDARMGRGIPFPAGADSSMTAYEVQQAADADRKDPNRRISPMEEILGERLGRPRKVEVKREDG